MVQFKGRGLKKGVGIWVQVYGLGFRSLVGVSEFGFVCRRGICRVISKYYRQLHGTTAALNVEARLYRQPGELHHKACLPAGETDMTRTTSPVFNT